MKKLKFYFVLIAVLLFTLLLSPQVTLFAQGGPDINEIRIDQPGSDSDEFFELAGAPGTSLDGLTYLVIGDGSGGSGTIESVVNLTGSSISGSGLFLVAEDNDTFGATADLLASLNFENSDNVTHLLVDGFTGANGQDLDTDNDGTLDVTPWTSIVDSVALLESIGSGDLTYASNTIGPDGFFVPGHMVQCPSGKFAIGPFDPATGIDSPGASNNCTTGLSIMDIQSNGQFSPFAGQAVETTGVVTLYSGNGRDFWLQDPNGDGNSDTSDGIVVDDGGLVFGAPSVGDIVQITAVVEEQQFGASLPLTRLDGPGAITIVSSGNSLPAPILLDDLPDETRTEGIDFWEPLEGMRVEVKNGRVTAPTNGFDEFGMVTQKDAKKGSGYFTEAKQLFLNDLGNNVVDYNPERIQVDDAAVETPDVRPGDQIDKLVGVVDYTFSMYKLQIDTIEGVEINSLPDIPVSKRTAKNHNLAVTTFNVENLFDLIDNPDKDDEGSTPSAGALETQLTKLALAIELELELPEIIVVQEIENQEIAQELADRVNSDTGTDYVATSFETSDGRGIEPGFLWDNNRVDLVNAFQIDDSIVPGTSAAFGPGSASPGREPIVGEFDVDGEEDGPSLWIVGNHFKSKGGDDPPYGVSFVRITEVQRKLQAQVVRDYANILLDANEDEWVIVTGDLNDFQFGEPDEGTDHPVAILEGDGGEVPLTNLVNLEKESERFTFIFDGNSQVLDHMLISPELLDMLVGADILHFNASYPDSLGSDASTPLRSSDHDALEGRFDLDIDDDDDGDNDDEDEDDGGDD